MMRAAVFGTVTLLLLVNVWGTSHPGSHEPHPIGDGASEEGRTVQPLSDTNSNSTSNVNGFTCMFPDLFSDGLCDTANNVESCGFDGGDCCEETCILNGAGERVQQRCGKAGYDCKDPFGESCRFSVWVGDGMCNKESNTPNCQWDGGDCCPETCLFPETCGLATPYDCRDPETKYGCDLPTHKGDGYCDAENNTPECDYDGGDCCDFTCIKSSGICGMGGYNCLDPKGYDEQCEDQRLFGDGICDEGNNNEGCFWDKGDCCSHTCLRGRFPQLCGSRGYHCRDPHVLDKDAEDSCHLSWYGDGDCDPINNVELCNWDGGDCCESTCKGPKCGKRHPFNCHDPEADENKLQDESPDCPSRKWLGNAICDPKFNTPECDYDGGDCCPDTCERLAARLAFEHPRMCQEDFYDCKEPNAMCMSSCNSHYDECMKAFHLRNGQVCELKRQDCLNECMEDLMSASEF